VGPRAGLDTEVRGKILCPCRGSNPDRPVVQPVADLFITHIQPSTGFGFGSMGPSSGRFYVITIGHDIEKPS
jgi:hypothetical protein